MWPSDQSQVPCSLDSRKTLPGASRENSHSSLSQQTGLDRPRASILDKMKYEISASDARRNFIFQMCEISHVDVTFFQTKLVSKEEFI